jgi:pilus assembly protein CpaF
LEVDSLNSVNKIIAVCGNSGSYKTATSVSLAATIAHKAPGASVAVVSWDHTNGIYTRLATLCLQKYANVPFNIILRLVCEAFPIAIFMKQLEDGKRHLMEIAECKYISGDQYDIRPLWTYKVQDEHRNEDGRVVIKGGFMKANRISEGLAKQLLDNGMPQKILNRYLGLGGGQK